MRISDWSSDVCSSDLNTLMRFVSRSVVVGFVNALAILIFLAQLPELIGMPWTVYAVCAAGLAIIYLLPLATKIVPSPLVAIVVLTIACVWMGLDIRTVGDNRPEERRVGNERVR